MDERDEQIKALITALGSASDLVMFLIEEKKLQPLKELRYIQRHRRARCKSIRAFTEFIKNLAVAFESLGFAGSVDGLTGFLQEMRNMGLIDRGGEGD